VKPGERPGANCIYIGLNEPANICERVVHLVGKELAKGGFDPWDIQVITPMHKGELGTVKFNRLLQSTINPPSSERREIRRGEKVIREGDRGDANAE